MMETKFTSGPWNVTPCDDGTLMVCTTGDTICFGDPNHKEPDDTANFHLIAAAPCLFEALKAITDQLERVGDTRPGKDGPFIDAARTALSRALGLNGQE